MALFRKKPRKSMESAPTESFELRSFKAKPEARAKVKAKLRKPTATFDKTRIS